ncbi:MAG: radical SAM protein [Deltaproteobacteria bacterium]|nr:radical SAM protein [Deltaproteobacteria bacterium]
MAIRYVEPLYRPPSEARSLILQATYGCSHNRCAFCVSFQGKPFRARPEAELFAEIDWAGGHIPFASRVFLADGDALVLSTRRLLRILERLRARLPSLERVTAYASPQNLRKKSIEDLRALKEAGLSMLYVGVESGDDEILARASKGATADEMIALCAKPTQAGMDLSVTVILGLGGPRLSQRHALGTARVLDAIAPRYASALTLMLGPRDPSFEECFGDPAWRMLSPLEILAECRAMLAAMQADGVTFHANHASNYLPLSGELQRDKARLISLIDSVLDDPDRARLRPEFLRRL